MMMVVLEGFEYPRLVSLPAGSKSSRAVLANKDGHIFPRSAVQCCVGGKPPIRFCSLSHKERTSCQLDLEFEETEDVVFMAKGTAGVYLSGYFLKPTSCNTTTISATTNNAQSIVVHEKEDIVKIDNDDSGGFKPQAMSVIAVDHGDPQACPTATELVRDADALDKQSGGINKELADVDNVDMCRSNKHMDGGNDAFLQQHANDEKEIEAVLAMVESDDRCVKESVHPKCNSEVPKADKGLGTDEELAVVKKMDRHICDNHVNGGNETFLQEHVTDENIGGAGLLTGTVSDDKCMKESVQKRCTSEVPKADIGLGDTPISELKKHSDGLDEELAGAENVDANVRHNHIGCNNEAILKDRITDGDNIGTGFMIDMSCRFIDESFETGNPLPPNYLLNINQDLVIHHLDGNGYARRHNSLSVSPRENFKKVNVGEENPDKLDLVQPNDALGSHSKLDDEGSHASAGIRSTRSHSKPKKEKKRNYDLDDGISKQASSQEHEFIFKEREKEIAKERAKEKDKAHDKKYGDGNKEKMQVGDPKDGDLSRNSSTNLNEVGTEDGAAEHREKTVIETDTFGDKSNSLLGDCIGRKRKQNEQPADCTDFSEKKEMEESEFTLHCNMLNKLHSLYRKPYHQISGDSCSEIAMDSVEAGRTDSEKDDNRRKEMRSKKRADRVERLHADAGNVQSSLEKLTKERNKKSHTFGDDKQPAKKRINEESKVVRDEAVVGSAKKKHKKVDVENVKGDADDGSEKGSISSYNQSHDVLLSSTVLEKPHVKVVKKRKKKVKTKVEESQKVSYSTKDKQHQAMCDRNTGDNDDVRHELGESQDFDHQAVTSKKELQASGTLRKRKVHTGSPREIVCCLPAASRPMSKLLTVTLPESGHTFDDDEQPAKKRINEESKVVREEAVVGSAKKKHKKVDVENVKGGGAEVSDMTVKELIEDTKSRVGGSNAGKHRHKEFVAEKIELISSYNQSDDVLLPSTVLKKLNGKDRKKKKKMVKTKVEESQKVACSTKEKQHQAMCDRNTGDNDVRHELGESQDFDHQAVTLKKELQASDILGKHKVHTGSSREIVCCLPAASSPMSKLLTGLSFSHFAQTLLDSTRRRFSSFVGLMKLKSEQLLLIFLQRGS
ncbi:hypothetical protein RJ640_003153 [Escallonia rubra]|uniref:peptidylprolyl isomerase n=1 Tax=Escallonia rubra TaxID=112253 RepID=A0AA88REW0_9ASTE|nr:hypothetical protein RJ640_003153 [Escallonia rubra]